MEEIFLKTTGEMSNSYSHPAGALTPTTPKRLAGLVANYSIPWPGEKPCRGINFQDVKCSNYCLGTSTFGFEVEVEWKWERGERNKEGRRGWITKTGGNRQGELLSFQPCIH
jgi:hypothetical protein